MAILCWLMVSFYALFYRPFLLKPTHVHKPADWCTGWTLHFSLPIITTCLLPGWRESGCAVCVCPPSMMGYWANWGDHFGNKSRYIYLTTQSPRTRTWQLYKIFSHFRDVSSWFFREIICYFHWIYQKKWRCDKVDLYNWKF